MGTHALRLWRSSAVAFGLAAMLSGCAQAAPNSTTYYVNFDRGNDELDGRSAATAWKHAPGDRNASGRAAASVLGPGTTLLFASGVRYRGEIVLNGSGSPEAPVVLTSEGASPAIIDGSDRALEVRPCRSPQDCGGSTEWSKLHLVKFREQQPEGAALFTDAGGLFPAQSPNTEDIFYSDNVREYYEVKPESLVSGSIRLPPELAQKVSAIGERRLALWVYGNVVRSREITQLDGDVARFDPSGLKFYQDRPGRFAVVGHPALVDRPGEYAFLEDRRAAVVFIPPGATTVSAASGRGGINLNGASNVAIRKLSFEAMADNGQSLKTGIAIAGQGEGSAGIRIEENVFQYFWMPLGQGVITLRSVSGLVISRNVIRGVSLGSGMRIGRSQDVQVLGNEISGINRTGIMLMGVKSALVAKNVISDARGVHGNGMSVYLGNKDIRILANTISDAARPMTFHGDGKAESVNNILIANNLFVGAPSSSSALTSWGKGTRKVTISGNLLVGGKFGLRLSDEDDDVVVGGNVLNGIAGPKQYPANWRVGENRQVQFKFEGGRDGRLQKSIAAALAGGRAEVDSLCSLFEGLPTEGTDEFGRSIGAKLTCDQATRAAGH